MRLRASGLTALAVVVDCSGVRMSCGSQCKHPLCVCLEIFEHVASTEMCVHSIHLMYIYACVCHNLVFVFLPVNDLGHVVDRGDRSKLGSMKCFV